MTARTEGAPRDVGGADPLEPAPELAELRRQVAGLRIALESRDRIGQAKGILMERHRITDDEAFTRLTRASQDCHLKLRQVADVLAETGELPAPGGPVRPG